MADTGQEPGPGTLSPGRRQSPSLPVRTRSGDNQHQPQENRRTRGEDSSNHPRVYFAEPEDSYPVGFLCHHHVNLVTSSSSWFSVSPS
jgi:hypothetical protein